MQKKRETFSSNFGLLMTMIGVAVGLGNVWRFPYMVGLFGGASFVLFYIAAVFFIGIPALMAEWTLGRSTRRGTLGAFEKGGLPGGKYVGFFFFFVVFCATGYYSNSIGWVGYYGISQVVNALGGAMNPEAILPPQQGFNLVSFLLQMLMTGLVLLAASLVLIKGLRKGIEKVSKIFMPLLFSILIILIIRAVTLPGSSEGIKWYIGSFDFKNLTAPVMAAALGQAIFSLSLGGTFMVVYGSYLEKSASIPKNAVFTALGDLFAGLLAGLAIFPALFAFGLAPDSGPGLIFSTLPKSFALMPLGWLFGLLFFAALFGAAYLSDVAALEVLVAGITDNTSIERKKAVRLVCGIVFLLAIPPMINFKIFVPWDLFFGSGMQTLGTFMAVITAVWCTKRASALKELARGSDKPFPLILYWWMRIVIPLAVLFVGLNWLLESVFQVKLLE
ncbi:MAG: sodium-dependent transporter [Candidatus Aminicenantes bacterium]|nr:sodium-dependent transporter [Candidatus Aminicenantes bacterium]